MGAIVGSKSGDLLGSGTSAADLRSVPAPGPGRWTRRPPTGAGCGRRA